MACQSLSLFESPASDLTGRVFEYQFFRCCSVFELVAVVISLGFSFVAATLACQRLSIIESPASDLTGRVFEYPSSRCCYAFEFLSLVIASGLFPASFTLACQSIFLVRSPTSDRARRVLGVPYSRLASKPCSVLEIVGPENILGLVPPAATFYLMALLFFDLFASNLTG